MLLRLEAISGVIGAPPAEPHVRCCFENYREGGAVAPPTAVAFAADGSVAAVGDLHGRATILHFLRRAEGVLYSRVDVFAALQQSSRFVEAGVAGRPLLRATRSHCPLSHLALSEAEGRLLFAAVGNLVLAVWTPNAADSLRLQGHQRAVQALQYLPSSDGRGWLVSSSADRAIVWDSPEFTRLRVLKEGCSLAVPLRLDGAAFLFGCDSNASLGLWNFRLEVADALAAAGWAEEPPPPGFCFSVVAAEGGLAVAAGPVKNGSLVVIVAYARAAGGAVKREATAARLDQRVLAAQVHQQQIYLTLENGCVHVRTREAAVALLEPWRLCVAPVVSANSRRAVAAAVHSANAEFYAFAASGDKMVALSSGGRVTVFDAQKTLALSLAGRKPVELLTMAKVARRSLPPPQVASDASPESPYSDRELKSSSEDPPPAPAAAPAAEPLARPLLGSLTPLSRRQGFLIAQIRLRIPVIRLPTNLFFLYTHPISDDGWLAQRIAPALQRMLGGRGSGSLELLVPPGSNSRLSAGESLSLELIRKTFLQKPPFSFPPTLRDDFWTLILQLPRRQAALSALTGRRSGGATAKQRLVGLVTKWAPRLKGVEWLEELVEPLIAKFGRRVLFCFETTMAILSWWGFLGCRFFRCSNEGPLDLVDDAESFVTADDGSGAPADEHWDSLTQLAGWQWFDSPRGQAPTHLAVFASFLLSRADPELWEHAVRLWGLAQDLDLEALPEQTADLLRGGGPAAAAPFPRTLEKLHLRVGHRVIWPLIRSFCACALPLPQVLTLWDHLLCQMGRPLLPVAAAVAVIKGLRDSLLRESSWREAAQLLLCSRRPQPLAKLLERCYELDSEISAVHFPQLAVNGPGRELCFGMRRSVAVSLRNLGWPIWQPSEETAAYPYLIPRDDWRHVERETVCLQHQSQELLTLLNARLAHLTALVQQEDQHEPERLKDICATMAKLQSEIRLETELRAAARGEAPTDSAILAHHERERLKDQIALQKQILALCTETAATVQSTQGLLHSQLPIGRAEGPAVETAVKQARVLSEEIRNAEREFEAAAEAEAGAEAGAEAEAEAEVSADAAATSSQSEGVEEETQAFDLAEPPPVYMTRPGFEPPSMRRHSLADYRVLEQQPQALTTGDLREGPEIGVTKRLLKALARGRRATEVLRRQRSISAPPAAALR